MLKKEFIFGFHAVEAILQQSPERVLQLYRQEGREDKRLESIISLAERQHIPLQIVSRATLDKWTAAERHQGILVEIKSFPVKEEKDLFQFIDGLEKAPFLLLLDEIQDPHNLGACLRSANAAGVDAVVITQDRSVGLTPTVRKIAVGAAETTPVFTVINLANTLRKLKSQGIWIYGLDGAAKKPLYDMDLKGPIGLVLGAEDKGLRRLSKELCDGLLAIPMQGSVESLNVSVAAGICLFEVLRQRRVN
ncbi:23S rRNA (guanosine-2'-O-)-methyltransferase RlmB [Candidatus Rickettsiella viridis]|uniref:23S rRNA (guanosine-2'-O-)-methyltransferase RlmB n=1 Tax=Candidatus Rickettsiella viridis TaxID=676208 RepID=A0A2Z5V748_9COXI|nr:23S rRNA (guanosine(2251)-2'-O)-methyltransferase RlmB [Candidatus Rickettsiella viridis]BBB15197.1 23S rRNA (guanosine-2'-O-)-methyltransferase RlmB [Candidatus Rickettsiella viridis]